MSAKKPARVLGSNTHMYMGEWSSLPFTSRPLHSAQTLLPHMPFVKSPPTPAEKQLRSLSQNEAQNRNNNKKKTCKSGAPLPWHKCHPPHLITLPYFSILEVRDQNTFRQHDAFFTIDLTPFGIPGETLHGRGRCHQGGGAL